jgi:hypothetical protein
LSFATDRFAGFTLNGIYSNNSRDANNTASGIVTTGGTAAANATATGLGINNNVAWGLGANYVWKKLNVDAAYQTSKNSTWTGGLQAAAAIPANATGGAVNFPANVMGTGIEMKQMYAGAVYDFGILKAYVQYVSNEMTSNVNPAVYVNRSAQQIGIRSFVTPKIEVWASGGNGAIQAAAGNAVGNTSTTRATQNFTGYQLGANYWLSKRTNLYGIFGSSQVASSSISASEGRSSYGLGLRHTF